MAKSLRSKHKRKMRAVKRVRYGVKELERLKKTVETKVTTKTDVDVIMTNYSEIATVTNAKSVQEKSNENMDDDSVKHVYNKHMRNQFGSYPSWMHQRKIKKNVKRFKQKLQETKKNKKKKGGKRKKTGKRNV